jgi:hypothetical protein
MSLTSLFLTDGSGATRGATLTVPGGYAADLAFGWASFTGLCNLADIDRIVL